MLSTVLKFITSKIGISTVLAIITLSVGVYIALLQSSLEGEIKKRKQAELNTELVISEFDKLYANNVNLQNDFDEQTLQHQYNIETLVSKHKQEIEDVIKITTIRVGITNVKDEDDGEVANILNDTIDALRMYK